MELSPRLLEEKRFPSRRRGYDPDAVDDFLERVAVAVAELHDRIADARRDAVVARAEVEAAEGRAAAMVDGAGPDRIHELETELAATRAELAAVRQQAVDAAETAASATEASAVAATLEAELGRTRAEADGLRARLAVADADIVDLRNRRPEAVAGPADEAARRRAAEIIRQAEEEAAQVVRAADEASQQRSRRLRDRLRAELLDLEQERSRLAGELDRLRVATHEASVAVVSGQR